MEAHEQDDRIPRSGKPEHGRAWYRAAPPTASGFPYHVGLMPRTSTSMPTDMAAVEPATIASGRSCVAPIRSIMLTQPSTPIRSSR